MNLLLFVIGIFLGGTVAWLVVRARILGRLAAADATVTALRETQAGAEAEARSLRTRLETEQQARAAAEASLEAERRNILEQRKLLDDAGQSLSETFKALSGDVLGSQSRTFLQLARETLGRFVTAAEGDLTRRQEAIDALVRPLKESLDRYDEQIHAIEKSRESAYGSLTEQLRALSAANEQLQKQTGSLENVLKGGPQVRGRWGEMTLRRVAELAGMSDRCDFVEQQTLATENGRLRPDMIVNLPSGRRIAVDAKAPLQAFLDAAAATTESERAASLARHGQFVRAHMNQLAARPYWEQFDSPLEMVILFLPGESFFSAALEQDRTLIEDGIQKRVLVATPTTLIALLRAVAYGWQQERLARNAQKVSELGKQLYDRLRTFSLHFIGVGKALKAAVDDYNRAAGSLESRVLASARKFKEMGAASGEELIEIDSVDEIPRTLNAAAEEQGVLPIAPDDDAEKSASPEGAK